MSPRRLALALAVAAGLLALVIGAVALRDDGADDDPPTAAGSGSTTTTTAPTDAGVGPNGFRPEPIEWDDCGGVDCAVVSVPLDYAEVDGPEIELYVSRVPATGERIGPLFVNPGGPGGSAAQMVAAFPFYAPESLIDRFDIIGVEPRGLAGSAPFDCGVDYRDLYGVDPTVEDAADRQVLIDTARSFAAGCARGAGELLAHVGTRDVARDLDAVRAAMGDAQLSYYGASYGTAIGQVYADLFPTRIRAMVIDGIVELGPTGLELGADQAAGFEVALQRFAEHCRQGSCETGDVVGAVEQVLRMAEDLDGIAAPGEDRPAGPGEVTIGLGQALYSESDWPTLDAALSAALRGDGSGFVELADSYLQVGDFDVYFAVNCIDYAWPSGDPDAFLDAADAAGQASPHFGEALVSDYLRCVDWPVPPDPLEPVAAEGAPPILVVSTTGDPATPYEAGVRTAERLASGVLLTYDGEGHTALGAGSSCINARLVAYLVDGTPPPDGTVCE